MALVAVNPGSPKPRESALDKILKGIQITQGVLGAAFEVPRYLRERGGQKLDQQIKKAQLATLPTPEEASDERMLKRGQTMAQILGTTDPAEEEGVDVIDFGGELGRRRFKPQPDEALDKLNTTMMTEVAKQYNIVHPRDRDHEGVQTIQLPGGQVLYGRRRLAIDPEISRREDEVRREFEEKVAQPMEQYQAFDRLMQAENNYAGAVSMLKNFALLSAPAIRRPGETVEDALAGGSYGAQLQNMWSQVQNTRELPSDVYQALRKEATKLIEPAKARIDFWSSIYKNRAAGEGLNPENVVYPVYSYELSKVKKKDKKEDKGLLSEARKLLESIPPGE